MVVLVKKNINVVNVAVEALCNNVGIIHKSSISLEDFNNLALRSVSTTLALEDYKETLSKIWNAILEALKKAIEWEIGKSTRLNSSHWLLSRMPSSA